MVLHFHPDRRHCLDRKLAEVSLQRTILTDLFVHFIQWIYPTTEAPYYPTGAKVSMGAAVILFVFPWILDFLLLRANKQREAKLAALPADHVFPEGPVSHMDGEF